MNNVRQNLNALDTVTAVLTGIRKDGARRSKAWDNVFGEVAKTLGLLSDHPFLRDDVQFNGLVADLIGVPDMELFFDRVVALQTYANRVAQAHGVVLPQVTGDASGSIITQQMPEHLTGLDEDLAQRTRLTMR